ncbi:hypothetical protein H4R33_000739 [Dimargaris cristalligena]|nr:hypothetical protein H4R33_000739 [Dimargaris cristalligena]
MSSSSSDLPLPMSTSALPASGVPGRRISQARPSLPPPIITSQTMLRDMGKRTFVSVGPRSTTEGTGVNGQYEPPPLTVVPLSHHQGQQLLPLAHLATVAQRTRSSPAMLLSSGGLASAPAEYHRAISFGSRLSDHSSVRAPGGHLSKADLETSVRSPGPGGSDPISPQALLDPYRLSHHRHPARLPPLTATVPSAIPPSPVTDGPSSRSVSDLLSEFTDQPDLLKLILQAKTEEDRRMAEEERHHAEVLRLEARRLDLERLRLACHKDEGHGRAGVATVPCSAMNESMGRNSNTIPDFAGVRDGVGLDNGVGPSKRTCTPSMPAGVTPIPPAVPHQQALNRFQLDHSQAASSSGSAVSRTVSSSGSGGVPENYHRSHSSLPGGHPIDPHRRGYGFGGGLSTTTTATTTTTTATSSTTSAFISFSAAPQLPTPVSQNPSPLAIQTTTILSSSEDRPGSRFVYESTQGPPHSRNYSDSAHGLHYSIQTSHLGYHRGPRSASCLTVAPRLPSPPSSYSNSSQRNGNKPTGGNSQSGSSGLPKRCHSSIASAAPSSASKKRCFSHEQVMEAMRLKLQANAQNRIRRMASLPSSPVTGPNEKAGNGSDSGAFSRIKGTHQFNSAMASTSTSPQMIEASSKSKAHKSKSTHPSHVGPASAYPSTSMANHFFPSSALALPTLRESASPLAPASLSSSAVSDSTQRTSSPRPMSASHRAHPLAQPYHHVPVTSAPGLHQTSPHHSATSPYYPGTLLNTPPRHPHAHPSGGVESVGHSSGSSLPPLRLPSPTSASTPIDRRSGGPRSPATPLSRHGSSGQPLPLPLPAPLSSSMASMTHCHPAPLLPPPPRQHLWPRQEYSPPTRSHPQPATLPPPAHEIVAPVNSAPAVTTASDWVSFSTGRY